MAWNLSVLIFARVLQALGGGALTPVGMTMISDVFPPKERGKALGYWGMGVIVGLDSTANSVFDVWGAAGGGVVTSNPGTFTSGAFAVAGVAGSGALGPTGFAA